MAIRVFGVGRVVADPEHPAPNGPVKFRLAVDDYNRQTKQREASFWQIIAWGKLGETVMSYAQKGKQIAVVGDLVKRSYVAKTGENREAVEITATSIELLGGGQSQNNSNESSW